MQKPGGRLVCERAKGTSYAWGKDFGLWPFTTIRDHTANVRFRPCLTSGFNLRFCPARGCSSLIGVQYEQRNAWTFVVESS